MAHSNLSCMLSAAHPSLCLRLGGQDNCGTSIRGQQPPLPTPLAKSHALNAPVRAPGTRTPAGSGCRHAPRRLSPAGTSTGSACPAGEEARTAPPLGWPTTTSWIELRGAPAGLQAAHTALPRHAGPSGWGGGGEARVRCNSFPCKRDRGSSEARALYERMSPRAIALPCHTLRQTATPHSPTAPAQARLPKAPPSACPVCPTPRSLRAPRLIRQLHKAFGPAAGQAGACRKASRPRAEEE